MANFSILPNSAEDPVNQYVSFLTNEVYKDSVYKYDINDSLFLQKIGLLRAECIQRAVETDGAVLYYGLKATNENISNTGISLGQKILNTASLITSSIDKGFIALNTSLNIGLSEVNDNLVDINSSINTVNNNIVQSNNHLRNLTYATLRGFSVMHQDLRQINQKIETINQNIVGIGKSVHLTNMLLGQGLRKLSSELRLSNYFLTNILNELKIPESQRERRYHIEEGMKFYLMAIKERDNLYYEDAIDEFNKAINIEKKDIYSYFYLAEIYLHSPEYINLDKAEYCIHKFIHYAKAETVHNNASLKEQLDEAYLMLGEICYIKRLPQEALDSIEKCADLNEKTVFLKIKYLSVMSDSHKREASLLLEKLLEKNPFISLQVLEDADILNNKYIIDLLERLRNELFSEAQKEYEYLIKEKDQTQYDFSKQYLNKSLLDVSQLLQSQSYLDSFKAIQLEEDIKLNYLPFVDLGLSVKWGKMNLGASTPEEYGDYLTFGAKVKSNYGISTDKISSFSKKVPDDNHNAVKVKKKCGLRMPTIEEFNELLDNCTKTWTGNYNGTGVAGLILTSNKTGYTNRSIFLPAAGYRNGSSIYVAGTIGIYWSSSLYKGNPYNAWSLFLDSNRPIKEINNLDCNFSVRPVCP